MTSKKNSTKEIYDQIWSDKKYWTVQYGYLNPGPGRPQSVDQLFKVVAEKIPFRAINAIKKQMIEEELALTGVYISHMTPWDTLVTLDVEIFFLGFSHILSRIHTNCIISHFM